MRHRTRIHAHGKGSVIYRAGLQPAGREIRAFRVPHLAIGALSRAVLRVHDLRLNPEFSADLQVPPMRPRALPTYLSERFSGVMWLKQT